MKRYLAILLTLVMLVSLIPAGAVTAAGKENAQQIVNTGGKVTTADGNITLSKYVAPTEKENYFDVTLSVTEKEIVEESSTDVVIVLDISNTMNSVHSGNADGDTTTRLTNAKSAAQTFISQYHDHPNLGSIRRLGVVTFNSDANVLIPLEQVNGTMLTQVAAITAPNGDRRFTNIEGGLRMAEDLLAKSTAAHKFIILITDGFPTTYTEKKDSKTGAYLGYDTFDTSGKIFKDRVRNLACQYGTNYSDEAAIRARKEATAIKNAGINIVSVGIDVNNEAQTIQKFLDSDKSRGIATVDRSSTSYEIGSASDSRSYRTWLGTQIGGGADIGSNAYYTGDSASELTKAFGAVLGLMENTVRRTMSNPAVLDPMGEHIDFLGFYNQSGKLVQTLSGRHVEGGENTADYTNAIHWNLGKSGYSLSQSKDDMDRTVAVYTYELKYRIRLENELVDFVSGRDYLTNDGAVLSYDPVDPNPDDDETPKKQEIPFPDPEVEGYLGSLSFTKLDAAGKALAGAEFTLKHKTDCNVCNGKVTVPDQVKVSGGDGKVSFTGIPSGHTYTLTETKVPSGYVQAPEHVVRVVKGTVTLYERDGETHADVQNEHYVIVDHPAVVISGDKQLIGRDLRAEEFAFRIRKTDAQFVPVENGYQETVKNTADGKFTFTALPYDATYAGTTNYYIVEEIAGDLGGVTYSEMLYRVTVTLDADMKAAVVYEKVDAAAENPATEAVNGILFTNRYVPESVSVPFSGTKTLTGRTLRTGGFIFQLFETDDTFAIAEEAMPLADVYNNEDGSYSFRAMTYSVPGVHYYAVRELNDGMGGVTYDDAVYQIQVTVADDLNGQLQATVLVNGEEKEATELDFVNSYTVSGETEAQFIGVKVLKGDTLKTGDFSFQLVDEDGGVLETVENDADGNFGFAPITYDTIGVYPYKAAPGMYVPGAVFCAFMKRKRIPEKTGIFRNVVYNGS